MSLYTNMSSPEGQNRPLCDLRSDTVTRPCAGMRAAMASAEVGDDVYGDDPTVVRLEARMAGQLGKAAALFMPSGTQSNLVAMMAHCGRGDEVITADAYHVNRYEAAGASVLAGIALCALPLNGRAMLTPDAVRAAIKEDDPHHPVSRLLCLENTHYGAATALDEIAPVVAVAREAGMGAHLDGARFFNAIAALGLAPDELAAPFDTISVCLSKGLGAPVGSVLVGDRDLIARARRHRKILGGGLRQAGVLAAAGLYALDHTVQTLPDDHARAARFGAALQAMGAGVVRVCTNMVFLTPTSRDHGALRSHLADRGVVISGQAGEIRLVLHRDVTDDTLDQAIDAFHDFAGA
ncbi:MAG: low-specificity L-threonine aldolase [Rhodobacteraceae bacterium]|nr:low-specificity L-threonine aldolase [Paracoccaceae bacterium]